MQARAHSMHSVRRTVTHSARARAPSACPRLALCMHSHFPPFSPISHPLPTFPAAGQGGSTPSKSCAASRGVEWVSAGGLPPIKHQPAAYTAGAASAAGALEWQEHGDSSASAAPPPEPPHVEPPPSSAEAAQHAIEQGSAANEDIPEYVSRLRSRRVSPASANGVAALRPRHPDYPSCRMCLSMVLDPPYTSSSTRCPHPHAARSKSGARLPANNRLWLPASLVGQVAVVIKGNLTPDMLPAHALEELVLAFSNRCAWRAAAGHAPQFLTLMLTHLHLEEALHMCTSCPGLGASRVLCVY